MWCALAMFAPCIQEISMRVLMVYVCVWGGGGGGGLGQGVYSCSAMRMLNRVLMGVFCCLCSLGYAWWVCLFGG